jgi:hypothetical protein
MASVLEEESQTRPVPASASVPRLWVWPAASRDNLVIITADELIVATVPRAKLAAAVAALESGLPTRDLIGPQDTRVALGSIVSLAASLNARKLVVEFERQWRKSTTRHFAVYDAEAQGEILEEVGRRMGPRAAYVRTTPNRLLHVMKPFNLLMAIAIVAGGFNYLAVNTFNIDSKGMPQDLPSGRESAQQRLVQFRKFATRLPKVRFVPFAGTVVLAAVVVTGVLLLTAGYQTTLIALMIAAGLSVFWIVRRWLFPPVTVSVVNSRFTIRD